MIEPADFKGLCALHGGMAQALIARPDVCADLLDLAAAPHFRDSGEAEMIRVINYAHAEGLAVTVDDYGTAGATLTLSG